MKIGISVEKEIFLYLNLMEPFYDRRISRRVSIVFADSGKLSSVIISILLPKEEIFI